MTPAVLDRPASLFDGAAEQSAPPPAPKSAPGRFARPIADGHGATLEERLTSVLHATRSNGSTECPVCDARMTSTPQGAECGGCGARLS
jgi:hypothetical protein